jgi:non-canonical (house-cleaning) NTP pyrophosphatase
MSDTLIIKVGSTLKDKVEPVDYIFKHCVAGHNEVIGLPAKSGVSDQPFGMKETMQGATNRAEDVWSPGTIAIGIEGGLVPLPDLNPLWKKILSKVPVIGKKFASQRIYLCMAVVAMKDGKGNLYYSTSAGMQFPAEEIEEARQRGVTVGVVLAYKFGGDHHDPRAILSFNRVHRRDSIQEAVKLVVFNVF